MFPKDLKNKMKLFSVSVHESSNNYKDLNESVPKKNWDVDKLRIWSEYPLTTFVNFATLLDGILTLCDFIEKRGKRSRKRRILV